MLYENKLEEDDEIVAAAELTKPAADYMILHSRSIQVRGIQPLGSKTKYKRVAVKKKPVPLPIGQLPEDLFKTGNDPNRRNRPEGQRLTPEREEVLKIGPGLSDEEREYLLQGLRKRDAVFAFEDAERGTLDPEVVPPVRIHTVPHVPWNDTPLKLSEPEEREIVALLREKIAAGVAERSRGPYASRWFCVRKPNGKLRWIQDLQKVNAVTIRDNNRPGCPDQIAERMCGRKRYTNVDLFSGYDQLLIDVRDRDLTAMHTPLGLIRLRVLPQGFTNSVAAFQRAMHVVLDGLIPEEAEVYIDDVEIACKNKDETTVNGIRNYIKAHIDAVFRVFDRFIRAGLTISGHKTEFLMLDTRILGYRVSEEGRKPEDKKTKALETWKVPTNLKELRSFLHFCAFYRAFVEKFAEKAAPLYSLTRKNVPWQWGDKQNRAFNTIRKSLLEPTVLVKPDYESLQERPLILTTDASPDACGAGLSQKQPNGKERTIRWESSSWNRREAKYPQLKRELLAVVFFLKKLRHYLYPSRFILRIDPMPLSQMLAKVEFPDAVIARWVAYVKSFDFKLERIPGRENVVSDGLSRSRDIQDSDAKDAFLEHDNAVNSLRVEETGTNESILQEVESEMDNLYGPAGNLQSREARYQGRTVRLYRVPTERARRGL